MVRPTDTMARGARDGNRSRARGEGGGGGGQSRTSPSYHEPCIPSSSCITSTVRPTGHLARSLANTFSFSSCRRLFTLGSHLPAHRALRHIHAGRSRSIPTSYTPGSGPSSSFACSSVTGSSSCSRCTVYTVGPPSAPSSPPSPPPLLAPPRSALFAPPGGSKPALPGLIRRRSLSRKRRDFGSSEPSSSKSTFCQLFTVVDTVPTRPWWTESGRTTRTREPTQICFVGSAVEPLSTQPPPFAPSSSTSHQPPSIETSSREVSSIALAKSSGVGGACGRSASRWTTARNTFSPSASPPSLPLSYTTSVASAASAGMPSVSSNSTSAPRAVKSTMRPAYQLPSYSPPSPPPSSGASTRMPAERPRFDPAAAYRSRFASADFCPSRLRRSSRCALCSSRLRLRSSSAFARAALRASSSAAFASRRARCCSSRAARRDSFSASRRARAASALSRCFTAACRCCSSSMVIR